MMRRLLAVAALSSVTGACVLLDFDGYALHGSGGHAGHAMGGNGHDGGAATTTTQTTTTGEWTRIDINSTDPASDIAAIGGAFYWTTSSSVDGYELPNGLPDWHKAVSSPLGLTVNASTVFVARQGAGADIAITRLARDDADDATGWAIANGPSGTLSDLLLHEDRLYVAIRDAAILWTLPLVGNSAVDVDVSLPILSLMTNGVRVFGRQQSQVLDITDGVASLWLAPPEGFDVAAVDEEHVYAAHNSGVFSYDLDQFGGSASGELVLDVKVACLAAEDGYVYLVEADGALWRVLGNGGALQRLGDHTFPSCEQMAVTEQAIFIRFGSNQGQLSAVLF